MKFWFRVPKNGENGGGLLEQVEVLGKVVYTVEYLMRMTKLAFHLTLAISLELGCFCAFLDWHNSKETQSGWASFIRSMTKAKQRPTACIGITYDDLANYWLLTTEGTTNVFDRWSGE